MTRTCLRRFTRSAKVNPSDASIVVVTTSVFTTVTSEVARFRLTEEADGVLGIDVGVADFEGGADDEGEGVSNP